MGKESILYHGVIPGFSQWGWVVPQKRFRRLCLDRCCEQTWKVPGESHCHSRTHCVGGSQESGLPPVV